MELKAVHPPNMNNVSNTMKISVDNSIDNYRDRHSHVPVTIIITYKFIAIDCLSLAGALI